jgi:hypothetical protein
MNRRVMGKILTICLFVFSFVFPPRACADSTEKYVFFPKGRSSVSYMGKLPFNHDCDSYFFPAKKGQTLKARITFDVPDAYLRNTRQKSWTRTGPLPVIGEYSIEVYDTSEKGINRAAYTFGISLR